MLTRVGVFKDYFQNSIAHGSEFNRLPDVGANPVLVKITDKVHRLGLPAEDVVRAELLGSHRDIGPGRNGDAANTRDGEDEVQAIGERLAAAVTVQRKGVEQPPLWYVESLLSSSSDRSWY